MTTTVGVVMALHAGVDPAHAREALASLEAQTRRPDEVVVVADGSLGPELDEVVRAVAHGPLAVRRVDLPCQAGAGPARQLGLETSRSDFVAIADADDVSLPDRLAVQEQAMVTGGLDLLGSAMEEFDAVTGEPLGLRRMPVEEAAVRRALRLTNPVNHPSLMLRRDIALASGGYRDLPFLEDYDLCARLASRGARLGNLDQVLVRFRGGRSAQRRRRVSAALRSEWQLQRNLRAYGLVPGPLMVRNWLLRTGYRMLPLPLAMSAYRRLFISDGDAGHLDRPGYDRHVDMSEVRGPLAEKFARQVLATTGVSEADAAGLDVLDIGSGYGDTAMALAASCRHVTCLEPALLLHTQAEERARELDLANMTFVHGGVEQLVARETYDLIVLDNVYEHLEHQDAALRAIWDALRPGGRLFLLTPNKLWPIEAHYMLPGLAWLPLPLANLYLRLSGRGTDYRDASYAPTYWRLKWALARTGDWDVAFTLPGDPSATVAGTPWHYRWGMAAIRRVPALWAISKALLVVARKPGEPSVEAEGER